LESKKEGRIDMILRVVVLYGLAVVFTFLIGGLQQGAGLLPDLTFLPQWGPGIAGLTRC
jgi:hypothetical protein